VNTKVARNLFIGPPQPISAKLEKKYFRFRTFSTGDCGL
jgi:hypothetical protein